MFRTCGRVAVLMVAASVGVLSQARHSGTDEARVLYYAAAYEQPLSGMERPHTEDRPKPETEVQVPPQLDAQPEFYTLLDRSVSRPVPIREHVPEPPVIKGIDSSGTIRLLVDIGIDGTVEGVTVEGTIHPRIEALFRQAATNWLYRPATLNGHPVKFRKALKVEIRR